MKSMTQSEYSRFTLYAMHLLIGLSTVLFIAIASASSTKLFGDTILREIIIISIGVFALEFAMNKHVSMGASRINTYAYYAFVAILPALLYTLFHLLMNT